MMKYKPHMWFLMKWLMKKPLSNHFGNGFTEAVLKRAKPIYRQMLTEVTDIGSNNPMAGNVYLAFVYLAIWKAAEGRISMEEYRQIVMEFIRQPVVQKVMGGMDINRPKDLAKLEAMLHKNADWLKKRPEYEPLSWDFNFDKARHQDGFYYHFTRCPLERYAREHDLLDALQICCDIDFETAKLYHAKLHREHTLASGGKICDYWYVPDQISNPR